MRCRDQSVSELLFLFFFFINLHSFYIALRWRGCDEYFSQRSRLKEYRWWLSRKFIIYKYLLLLRVRAFEISTDNKRITFNSFIFFFGFLKDTHLENPWEYFANKNPNKKLCLNLTKLLIPIQRTVFIQTVHNPIFNLSDIYLEGSNKTSNLNKLNGNSQQ